MINIKTFQDFQTATNKNNFIINAINEFKTSSLYACSIDAKLYYVGENTTIAKRLQWFYDGDGRKREDIFKANNRIGNNFLNYIVTQQVSTLLSNGLTTSDDIKKGLGKKFDIKLQLAGLKCAVDSVSWGYCYITPNGFDIDIWGGNELIPLFDERTSKLKAAIRFWQIDIDKNIYVELYEEDGKTEYEVLTDNKKSELREVTPKTSYKTTTKSDVISSIITDSSNWTKLPIFPLYANETKTSVFTRAFKSKNDLYDIIYSDFGNNLEDSQDVYWVLKNYQGQDMGEFLADYKEYRTIKVDEDGDATSHTLEVPYLARETALKMLEASIYKEAMALDTSTLTGSSLNTTAIQAASDALNKKVDKFEWQVIEFCDDIIQLYLEYVNKPNEDYEINFIRNGLINDTDVIDNIYKMRTDISHETALRLNPMVENPIEEIDLVEAEGLSKYSLPEEEV